MIILFFLVTIFLCGCENNQTNNNTSVVNNSSHPNILLIIADDLGVDAMAGFNEIGAIKPNMPNIQSLASNGITFDNFWSYPVCSPTRSSILTGRYGFRTGVLNAEESSTLPTTETILQSYLSDNLNKIYSHSIIGKWHLSNNEPNRPTQMGVDYYAGLLGGGVKDYNSWSFTENGETNPFDGYITSKITDLTIDWIKQQEQPWFAWVAYTAPHTPFHFPETRLHSQGNLPFDQASIDANPLPYFLAMVESMDYEVGRLLDSLPFGELENTIILFMGDNGTHPQVLQAPYIRRQGKGSLFQGGIHTPLIVSGKGVSRINDRDSSLISSTDLFSTIAEIAGLNLPRYEDSYSFKPLLTKDTTHSKTINYSESLNLNNSNNSGYAIRDTQYKLIQLNNGTQMLYNLKTDPYEASNLISEELTPELTLVLQKLLNEATNIRK